MRIGIIGCGLIGQKRASFITEEHQVVVVADNDVLKAEHLGRKIGARFTSDWSDVINETLDIVIIATPHQYLADIGLAAVLANKHVLLEKPAARTSTEILALIHAAEEKNRIVKVGFNHRFHPAFLASRSLIDEGILGPLMFIRARYGHGGRVGYDKEWRCKSEISGGGQLIDQGAHLIDLSRWFLGDLKLDYSAALTTYWPIEVDDNCFLALRGTKGEMAWLHASWTEWRNVFSFEIYGKNAKLAINGLGGTYGTEQLTLYKMLPQMGPPEITTWEYPFIDNSWELEFRDFILAIKENRQPNGDIYDAKAMLEIVDQAYSRSVYDYCT